jgi:uncharacterized protein (DUF2147 family)
MKKVVLLWLAALSLLLPAPIAHADDGADAILGVWHTTGNKSAVRIFKKDNQYCADVVSLMHPNWPNDDKLGMGGKPKTDRINPDPKLRDHPIVGLQFMSGFSYSGGKVWAGGKIYDPESGKTYKGKMTLKTNGELELHGYVGISLFGRTVTWTR